MIYLRTIRLDFLDVGPNIQNLEIFEHLENLYLQYNKISEIGQGLAMNVNLVFLALHGNQLKRVEGLSHLRRLAFLDLSNNLIEDLPDVKSCLPCESMMILKLHGNPMESNSYRKRIVLAMPKLEELDRLKVVQAERLFYRGLIKLDLDKLLEQYRRERGESDAKDKMERDLYLDFMEDKGQESQQRMMKSLDEFAKMDEFESLKAQFTDIMHEHKQQKDLLETKAGYQTKEIDTRVTEVMDRYSR